MNESTGKSPLAGNPDFAGGNQGQGMGVTFGKTLENMRFIGVAGLVYGILTCLSLVGAIIGVPIIIAANRFLESVKMLEQYRASNRLEDMEAAFHEMGRSFRLLKIVVMISIGMTVLYMAFAFLFGGLTILSSLANG